MNKKQTRDTHSIFDLTIKYVLQETSPVNAVYLVNGLFERRYPSDSPVHFRRTERVRKRGKRLEHFRADMILSIGDDDFAIEFEISTDEIIGLRIFEYGFGYAYNTKQVEGNGTLIEMNLPEGCVVYWESTPQTPDHITFRLRRKADGNTFDYDIRVFKMADQSLESLEDRKLLVLLPFCLLKFRKDLQKKRITGEERQTVAEAEKQMLEALEGILTRSLEQGIVSSGDCIMILESIAQMHEELYPEFQEAGMVLDDRIKLRWKAHEQEILKQRQEVLKQRDAHIIGLFRQGYSPDEVEKLLAQDAGKPDDLPANP